MQLIKQSLCQFQFHSLNLKKSPCFQLFCRCLLPQWQHLLHQRKGIAALPQVLSYWICELSPTRSA